MTTPLQQAAQAMIDRWESPDWKDTPHTAHYVAELRKALGAELAQSEPDCVARIVVFGKGWKLDYLSLPVGVHDLYARSFTYTQPQATTPVPDDAIIKEIERSIVDHCTGGDLWMSASLGKDRIKRLLIAAAQGEKT